MSTKGCAGFFLFCLDLELFAKIEDLVSTNSFFTLINNSRSKQNKNKTAYMPLSLGDSIAEQ